jgi:hypothetical protein
MGASSLRDKADVFAVLAENKPYLRELSGPLPLVTVTLGASGGIGALAAG